MQKDFDSWNSLKKHVNEEFGILPYFREGEIWWVHLGINIGYEMDGKGNEYSRPILVIKKYNQYSFLSAPLSTSTKPNIYRVYVGLIRGRKSFVNLSQLRNIDSRRLINKSCSLDTHVFEKIKEKASELNFR